MSTVPVPTPTCKTLISELYGERPTAQASQQAARTVHFDTAWTTAVRRVSELAQARLPEALHGRIQRASGLVLAQGVFLDEDGHTCQVRASDGHTWYSANGSCPCADHQRAPERLCKHRLARGIYLRASELLREGLPPVAQAFDTDTLPALPSPLPPGEDWAPHAPASTVPPQYVVMIQGTRFVKFAGLLALAHAHGLQSLTADWTHNAEMLSLAHAIAVFPFGRFEDSGDATPENVTKKVAPHFRRVALTRAKARALRDALGVDLVAVEELAED